MSKCEGLDWMTTMTTILLANMGINPPKTKFNGQQCWKLLEQYLQQQCAELNVFHIKQIWNFLHKQQPRRISICQYKYLTVSNIISNITEKTYSITTYNCTWHMAQQLVISRHSVLYTLSHFALFFSLHY